MISPRTVLAVCLVAPSLVAQTTWIVDQAGGPGASFTDLPPALAVAQADDIVQVRPGGYSGGATSAGIRLLFEDGAVLNSGQTLAVEDLPAGQRMLLAGLSRPSLLDTVPVFRAERCAGQVVVERLVTMSVQFLLSFPTVGVQDCAHLSFTDCSLSGTFPLEIERSQVLLTDSTVTGATPLGAPAVWARDTLLLVSETQISGADGSLGISDVGLRVERSAALITGSGARGIAAGKTCSRFGGCSPTATPALDNLQSVVIVDPRVPVGRLAGRAPIPVPQPALRANGAGLGEELETELWPHANGSAVLAVSAPGPFQWTPWGPLGLSANHLVLYTQPVEAGAALPFSTIINAALFPFEGSLTVQAVVLDTGGGLTLTNPADVVLF